MTQIDKDILHAIAELVRVYGISSRFGVRLWRGKEQFHNGIDIPCPVGTRIFIPARVWRVYWDGQHGGGLSCVVLTAQHRYSFAHLQQVEVGSGGIVLHTGNTGVTTGPHLHFTVWAGGWLDPEELIAST